MTEHSQIPLCDLKAQYETIKTEVTAAMADVVESRAFIKGPAVKEFEREYAAAHELGASNAVGCSSGTSALTVALKALNLPSGAEVIMPSHTFFATAESIILAGGTPVFTDIKPSDYTIDPAQVEAQITERTKAIVPVHIYGTMADMDALTEIAAKHNLLLIEDSAQAHFATWNGTKAGVLGDAGAFSFYPGKNLGAYGDAGMAISKHTEVANRIRKLIDHGRHDKYLHDMVGDNMRIDSLQAAVLSVKLKRLADWSARRRAIAKQYDDIFRDKGFKTIEPDARCEPVYHLYVVEVSNRADVIEHLKSEAIACGVHYPVPVHAQPAMKGVATKTISLNVTERIVDRIISLPIYPEMTQKQVERVCKAFLDVAVV